MDKEHSSSCTALREIKITPFLNLDFIRSLGNSVTSLPPFPSPREKEIGEAV